jgi:hypothetical protein
MKNHLITLTDAVSNAFMCVAAVYLALWMLPPLAQALKIDPIASAPTACLVLALFGLLKPFLYRASVKARMERALQEELTASKKDRESR